MHVWSAGSCFTLPRKYFSFKFVAEYTYMSKVCKRAAPTESTIIHDVYGILHVYMYICILPHHVYLILSINHKLNTQF